MLTHRVLKPNDYPALHQLFLKADMEYVPTSYSEFIRVAPFVFYYGGFKDGKLVSSIELFEDGLYPRSLGCGLCCDPDYSRRCWSKGMFQNVFELAFTLPDVDYLWAEADEDHVEKCLRVLGFTKVRTDDTGLHFYAINRKAVLPALRK